MQMTKIEAVAAVVPTVLAPWDKCFVAPENMRPNQDLESDDVPVLAESLTTTVGLISNPVGYEAEGKFWITAGGRRMRAGKLLKAQKRLPKSLKAGLPIILRSREEAVAISLAENAHQLATTPAQEFKAYRDLAAQGLDALTIARMTGSGERHVERMLRLTAVSPVVLAAFDRQEIDLDALRAFSVSLDHARQQEVLEAGISHSSAVRQALTSQAVKSSDPRAKVVGIESYVAAGGRVSEDLFGTDTWFLDAPILDRLVEALLSEQEEALRSAGWSEVIRADGLTSLLHLRPTYPSSREMTDAEMAEATSLQATMENTDDDNEFNEASDKLDRLFAGLSSFSPEQLATGTAVISLNHSGEIYIDYFEPRTSSADSRTLGAAPSKPKPDFGHAGHERMTRIGTVAVRNGLAANPGAAYDVLVAHLGWSLLRCSRSYGTSYALPLARASQVECEGSNLKGDDEFGALFDRWNDALPTEITAFYEAVEALSFDEKQSLLALCVALQVNAVEPRADQRREEAWGQLQLAARRIALNVRDLWTPNEDFLAGAGKARLLDTLKDIGQDVEPFRAEKKGALVQIVARAAKAQRWVPKMLADLGSAIPGSKLDD
jgi:ParB family transcriptional regulator, chromosome partitioning protein